MILAAALLLTVAPPPGSAAAAARIVGGALAGPGAFARLADLTDTVGPRLSGSPGAAAALRWAQERLREDGLHPRLEPVEVPHWVRGEERASVLGSATAAALPLAVTALGGSIGTPAGGLTAEVVEVQGFDELRGLGDRARGKIVLFQHAMSTPQGYGEFAVLRHRGAVEAARAGAVAALVRSLATASLRSPHTGMMSYAEDTAQIPAAAVATEDAELLHRLLSRGPVRVQLFLGCRTLAPVQSANVVAEIAGRERPEEIVLVGAHLDSWDLAQGAVDDGAGVVIALETARLLARENPRPRRTLRIVLFMNEENGLAGGKAYARAHESELSLHVAALEADSGAGRPLGVQLRAGAGGEDLLRPWLFALEALGAGAILQGGEGGADLSPLARAQVPIAGVRQDATHYFDVHHTAADTLDKANPRDLAESAAAVAWLAYALAEMRERPARPAPPQDPAAPRSAGGADAARH